MAINQNKSDEEALGKRIYHAFLELTISCVISIVALGTAFIIGGYCLQQTQTYPILALSLISIGSSLIGIGIIAIPFKAAAVHLMDEKIVKNAATTTIKEMEHTYIPKMILKRANISVTIVASENNNIPKMEISEQLILRNLQERVIDQRKREVLLYDGQKHKINNIEVNIKGTNSKITPSSVKHSQIIAGSEKTEKYDYIIPFVSALNKGEDVCIKEEYEWSPCRATPNTSDYDEFAYRLTFPTEELVMRMKAEDNFYFISLEKIVTDWMSKREISVQSSPVVTKETNGLIKEVEWNIPLSDLTHLAEYEIRFRLGII